MRNEKGKAVLELAIVLPFFVILFMGLADISFIIRKQQYLSVAVREAGNAAYRECSNASEGSPTEGCLRSSASETLSFITNSAGVITGTNLLVKSWKVTNGAPIVKGEFNPGNENSKFTPDSIMNLNSYDKDLRETVITVEVFLDNTNSTLPFFSRRLYETMIF